MFSAALPGMRVRPGEGPGFPSNRGDFGCGDRGQGQAGLADVLVAPPQLVPEGTAVEAQARVKISPG
jgi:hypothetical protein